MKAEQLERVLDGVAGVRKEGPAWLFPEDNEVTLVLAIGSEAMTVQRIARYERVGELAVLESQTGDRYHFPVELVTIVKSSAKRTAKSGASVPGSIMVVDLPADYRRAVSGSGRFQRMPKTQAGWPRHWHVRSTTSAGPPARNSTAAWKNPWLDRQKVSYASG